MSKKHKRQFQSPAPSSAPISRSEFNPDYTIIKHELKRIGVLAGALIVILIILSFFQNQILGLFIK